MSERELHVQQVAQRVLMETSSVAEAIAVGIEAALNWQEQSPPMGCPRCGGEVRRCFDCSHTETLT